MRTALVLDYETWICGRPDCNLGTGITHGQGNTALLNHFDYMCCLGQFSLQMYTGLDKLDLLDKASPSDLKCRIPFLTYGDINSCLSLRAMKINDSCEKTIPQKMYDLYKLFWENSFEIEFINFPQEIMDAYFHKRRILT